MCVSRNNLKESSSSGIEPWKVLVIEIISW